MSAAARPNVLGTEVFPADRERQQCRVLWLTVLHDAIRELRVRRYESLKSFLGRQDFETLCALAEVEPEAVERAAHGLPAFSYYPHGRREVRR